MLRARGTLAAGLVLASELMAADPVWARTGTVIPLMVMIDNQAGVGANVLEQGRQSAGRLFEQIDVQLVWVDPSDASLADWSVLRSILVVHLVHHELANCTKRPDSALGFAVPGSHFATVFFDEIQSLGRPRESDIGQILGNVIAHEIGHLLLPPPGHSVSGIMQPSLQTGLAVHGMLFFTRGEARLIRAKLGAPKP